MHANPISRTLARLGLHGLAHEEEKPQLRPLFNESEAPPPPPRIPPHQRHLYVKQDDALRGYSMGLYRPAASSLRTQVAEATVETTAKKPAKRAAKTHRRGKASPAAA